MRLPQFTIRDVLWLTVVVSLSLALWIEHRYSHELREQLERAWWWHGPGFRSGISQEVDWSVLNKQSRDPDFDYGTGWRK